MERLTPREVMEKIKENRKLSNRTKDEWLVERNKVDLETKNVKENETEKTALILFEIARYQSGGALRGSSDLIDI